MRATAIGFNNMAMVISGAIVQPLMGKLLQFHVSFISSFKLSMLIILFSYITAILVSFLKINETYYLDAVEDSVLISSPCISKNSVSKESGRSSAMVLILQSPVRLNI
jgi:hypothetical protein